MFLYVCTYIGGLRGSFVTGFKKLIQITHLVFENCQSEARIQPTVALFCRGVAMLDLQHTI